MLWPVQLLLTIGALLPKPGKNDDRIIGLLPLQVKLWGKIRGVLTDSWSEGLEAFWDSAIKGSSALRAALVRSLLNETAYNMGISATTLYADLARFFDTISFELLLTVQATRKPQELRLAPP